MHLGPSKNYVTPKRGGVDDFVTYPYVHIEREGVFYEIVT